MFARSRALAVFIGVALVVGPVSAWADMYPPQEDYGDQVGVSVEVSGLSRFPDHVFYVYPVYCTHELALLLEHATLWETEDDGGRPNYIELRDGPLASWLGPDSECTGSTLYALARDVAASVDFGAMTLAALNTFFTEDPRLFRSSFEFVERPLYAATGSPLSSVAEVVRVLAIDATEVSVVLDSATYRFSDGTLQTLKLGHTRRPPLPFRPLKPEKVAKYAMVNAKWEVRQAVGPAVAPRLPEGAELGEGTTDSADAAGTTEVAGTAGTTGVAGTTEVAGTTGVAAAGVLEAAPVQPMPAASAVRVVEAPASAEARATPAPASAPALDPFSSRAWPLGAGLGGVVLLICGVLFARRRRAAAAREPRR